MIREAGSPLPLSVPRLSRSPPGSAVLGAPVTRQITSPTSSATSIEPSGPMADTHRPSIGGALVRGQEAGQDIAHGPGGATVQKGTKATLLAASNLLRFQELTRCPSAVTVTEAERRAGREANTSPGDAVCPPNAQSGVMAVDKIAGCHGHRSSTIQTQPAEGPAVEAAVAHRCE